MRLDFALDPEERAAVTRLVEAGLVAPEAAARARVVVATAGALDDVRGQGGRAVGLRLPAGLPTMGRCPAR